MELHGRNSGQTSEWNDAGTDPDTGLEEPMWRMGISGPEGYPERPGVSDCVYYMRTGFCGYGARCRFNHPRDRAKIVAATRIGVGEYPERPGEPLCQYYLKNGTCKFGATCKFNHPRNASGLMTNAPLNYQGYPLRPGEKECSYYLKTGQCKFGTSCKFHHPSPTGVLMPTPTPAPPFYPQVQSPIIPEQTPGSSSSGYRVPRPLVMPGGSYVPGTYGPLLLSPGVVPVPGWNSYSGPLSPLASPGAQPGGGGPGPIYGVSPLSPSTPGVAGSYPVIPSPVGPVGVDPGPTREPQHKLPERPGEPECQYYMKTGNCKFGLSCKYHHPPDRAASPAFLGPLGLPLRPGAQPCSFYLQNGCCKFGPTCKFDHPVGTTKYNPLTQVSVYPYLATSSLATTLPPSFSSTDRPSHPSLTSTSPVNAQPRGVDQVHGSS